MKFLWIFARILIFFVVKIFLAEAKDCLVDTRTGMNQNAPPLVSFSTNPPVYIDPRTQATLVFQTKSKVDVACPVPSTASSQIQKNRVLVLNKHINLSKSIKCENGVFKYDGNIINYRDISCNQATDCLVYIKTDMNKKSPPLVLSSTNPPKYFYSPIDNPGNLVFKTGSTVNVLCPGKTNPASTEVLNEGEVLVKDKALDLSKPIQCVNGLFQYNGNIINFEDISCNEQPRLCYNAIQKEASKKCNKGHNDMYEIGYDFKSKGFLKTLELCHDKDKAKTLWAHDVIVPVNQQDYRYSGPSKSFKVANLYQGMKMSKIDPYNLENAYQNAVKILGPAKATEYFSRKTSDSRYLAKGHLIANADKFFKSEQDSTYFYANAVPMWQKINAPGGNWFHIEDYVRYLAFKKGHVLDIYAGGIGTLKLEDKEIDLYLDGTKKMIPVPKVIFKCVIDHQLKEAICFLVVNNLYISKQVIESSGKDYIVCDAYKNCNTYLPDYHIAERGYLYCCNLENFHDATRDELGLQDIAPYISYKEMTL